MTLIDVQQAQKQFAKLIELAMSGEEVIIEKDNHPIVKLTAVKRSKKQRKFGSAKGMIQIADDFDEPLEDFSEYM
ncbi:MAG TPA: DUF2281 domain-containing protein [Anaerolineales bacterium]|nr:DUF2281 domain-containing protein [Anaerolineales bacterium]